MGVESETIPTIDVTPLLGKCDSLEGAEIEGFLEVVRKLDAACRETGFFYVKGHGIEDSLLEKVRTISHSFFNLPYEEKIKIKLTPKTGFRGYQRVGENLTQSKPDMQEAIDCYKEVESRLYGDLGATFAGPNLWPEHPSEFKQVMEEYVSLLKDLSRRIARWLALALGGPADAFEGERAGDTFWSLRVLGYPSSLDMVNCTDIGCGAHSDYGLLAFINQDNGVVALQDQSDSCVGRLACKVQNSDGKWIDIPPIPGTFICNVGNMLKIWSNGEYNAAIHRVINNSPHYRVSLAFFYEPNLDASVEPLDFCKEKAAGVAKLDKVIYGEYLVRKVHANFGLPAPSTSSST